MQDKVSDHYLGWGGKLALSGFLAARVQDFAHPREVLLDQELDPIEKREILAAWASDASAVESHPGFRWLRGTPGPVAFCHVFDALRALDEETERESALISTVRSQRRGRGASS